MLLYNVFLSLFLDVNYETTVNWVNPEWENLKVFSETNLLYEIIFMRCLERGRDLNIFNTQDPYF